MNDTDPITEPGLLRTHRRASEILLLTIIILACLVPFLDKAFHIDDLLFIRTAQQIQRHPLDFYGFSINWSGREAQMSEVTKNPPLASYVLAAAASIGGWSEIALHVAFLLPAIGVALGTYVLAMRLNARPLSAALLALLTPVFLISATGVMCDILMLCFWIWAVVLWLDGIEQSSALRLLAAAVLMSLAALTKYFGIALIPLLAAYTIYRNRSLRSWAAYVLIPVCTLALYQWWTSRIYGRGLLGDAASYAANIGGLGSTETLPRLLKGLAFTGGCCAPALLFSHRLWSRKILAAGGALLLILIALVPAVNLLGGSPIFRGTAGNTGAVVQFALFTVGGVSLIGLAVSELRKKRDLPSVFLFLWILGTFFFAALINWTINGRSLLPMVPAAGILIARREGEIHRPFFPGEAVPLLLCGLLALATTYADFTLAANARNAARGVTAALAGRRVWFEGHWGFQYYMEESGARPLDVGRAHLERGDIVVIPMNNTALFALPETAVPRLKTIRFSSLPWLATMNHEAGAGFYSDIWGPLPFVFAAVPEERYEIYRVQQAVESD